MMAWEDFGIDIRGKASGEVKTICPRCSPSRKKSKYPCLNCNIEKSTWHCWHCEWSGSLYSGEEGKSSRPATMPKIYKKPSYSAPMSHPSSVQEWFAARGIPLEVLQRRQIGSGVVYMPQVEEEVVAIQFPYFRDSEAVNIKYRDRQKNFRMVAGAERILYGLDDIQGDTVVICEGEVDCMSIEVAGYPSVVSVPDGAPAPGTKNYASKFDFLVSAENLLAPLHSIVIAVDTDAPGTVLAAELARRLGPERCLSVTWPEGCKDANEVLMRHGAVAVRSAIDQAAPWPIGGIGTGATLARAVEALYDEPPPRGASTGWIELDQYYTVRPGEVTIVTGIPSHGKSAWVSALAVNLAKTQGWSFTLFSPENAPMERYGAMLTALYIGKGFWGTNRMSREEMHEGNAWVWRHVSTLTPEDEAPTLDRLLTLAKVQVYRQGIKGLVLDPWNEVDFSRPAGQSETEYVSASLSKIRRFALLHGVHVWVVAHPTKLQKAMSGTYEGQYPPPTPYDISGSANFRNKADNCVTIWRDVDKNDNRVDVFIQKVRFLSVGKPGKSVLIYDPTCGRFREPRLEDQAWSGANGVSSGVSSGR